MKRIRILLKIALATLLLCSCASQTPSPTKTPTPTVPAPVITASATPVPTSSPTPTTTPIPAWVTDFAEPILKIIEDQPPAFQDDFSDANSYWETGKQAMDFDPKVQFPGTHIFGERGYSDGEYFATADPVSCVGGTNIRIAAYRDFVAEFDARLVSGVNGDWQLQFRRIENGVYSLTQNSDSGDFSIHKWVKNMPEHEGLITHVGNQGRDPGKWSHMILIVRGAKMAVYADKTPLMYGEDKSYSAESPKGTFSLDVCNFGDVPMEARWDNLKLWDISTLP